MRAFKGLLIFTTILLYPFAEIYLLLWVAQQIGYFNTFLVVLFSAVVGLSILRNVGFRLLKQSSQSLQKGQLPADAMLNGVQFVIAGLLFMIPGFLSDLLALLIVFPLTRKVVNVMIKYYFLKRIRNGSFQFNGSTAWTGPDNSQARDVKDALVIDLETIKMQRLQGPKQDS